MDICSAVLSAPSVAEAEVEVVERKGLGHPDSLCDALAEAFSQALCRFYRERFGLILHHNVDKVLLCGGESRPAFGGGEVTRPIDIILSGRAATHFDGTEVPVAELAVETCRQWLREHLHALDADRHVRLRSRVRPGSRDLVELYLRQKRSGVWLANDTSCGVGFAPLSPLESTVYEAERRLNSPSIRERHPEIGEDVKVMGVRRRGDIHLTVACAMIGRFLENKEHYLAAKGDIVDLVQAAAAPLAAGPVSVDVNTADDVSAESFYLTVTGTSAEAGDDGEAGRGNRVNGLITPYRPMTMESVAGKNPVTHVGKLYNLCAGLLAEAVVKHIPEVTSAHCWLVSQIGRPIDAPQIVDVRVRLGEARPGIALPALIEAAIQEITREGLKDLPMLSDALLDGRLGLDRWPLHSD